MSTLYLVATPIGNLEDISARALRVLREVPLIAAEDTRHTRQLLTHFDIHTELTSYHDHNKAVKTQTILDKLAVGDLALVSDAGMPAINDPGYELVKAAITAGHTVTPIPGPSAPIAALAASGLPTDAFLYLGYLPRKHKERVAFLGAIEKQPYTLIFLETPHRLAEALEDILQILGNRQAVVARELTKHYEEFVRGYTASVLAHFQAQEPRGEITLLVAGHAAAEETTWDETGVLALAKKHLAEGLSASQAASQTAAKTGWPKKKIYQMLNAQ